MDASRGPIIDAHFHHWNTDRYVQSAAAKASARGVMEIWVSGLHGAGPVTEESRAAIMRTNDITRALMRQHGGLFRGFVYVDPTDERRALEDVQCATEQEGMIGIKLWISCFCDDARVSPIAAYAQRRRLPVLVHAWDKATGNLPGESTAVHVARLAAQFPGLPVMMAHHGGDWIPAIRQVECLPNVLVDTSGSIQDHGLVDYMVARLGAKRVLFGTDCSDFDTQVAKVLAARISGEARRLVFAGNALRLLENIR